MSGRERSSAAAGLSVISDQADVLGAALALWATRDDSRPQPGTRLAAGTAVRCIDQMLTGLHRLRSDLVTEIRTSDDSAAARVDALLVRCRDGGAS